MSQQCYREEYRGASSAGSFHSKVAGFITRAHSAIRLSFPVAQAQRAVARIIAIAMALGYESDVMLAALTKVAGKYRKVLDPEFCSTVRRALGSKDTYTHARSYEPWAIVNTGIIT